MNENDLVQLSHMLEAARDALRFCEGRNRDDLQLDRMLTLALVKAVEIIGEAARRVTHAGRLEKPNIPWVDIIGMRNRLVHVYFDINLNILWTTVVDDLPALIAELEKPANS